MSRTAPKMHCSSPLPAFAQSSRVLAGSCARVPRRVTSVRLEAQLDEALLAFPAPVGRLLPVPADARQDLRGDQQVAVRLVRPRDDPARVEQVVLLQPRRGDPVGRLLVLHEDAAAARDLVEVGAEPVAEPQRARQVVQRVEHQPVAEAVDALVVDERARRALRLLADRARDRRDLRFRDIGELPLEQAVVVAGRADPVSLGERGADVAVVVLERGGADRVGDPVAVRLDGVLPELLLEECEGGLRALAKRDVAERLPPAVRVEASFEPLRVGLERLDLRDCRGGPARLPARHECGDVADLLLGELALERRHPPATDLHLADDFVEGRARVVEVRADRAARPGGLERVAVAAAGVGKHLGARRGTGLGRVGGVVSAAPREEPDAGENGQRCEPGAHRPRVVGIP